MKTMIAVAAAFLSLAAASAQASITTNFDTITSGATVDSYYAGGTDSFGETGPNYGVTFTPGDWVVASGFGETSQPNFAYSNSGAGAVDVAGGFTKELSFTFGVFVPSTVSVYSGLDGSGTLLGSLTDITASPFAFAPASLAFSGVAHSIVISSGAAQFGWDDLTLGGVPEPGTWMLMLIGFGALGFALRSRNGALTRA